MSAVVVSAETEFALGAARSEALARLTDGLDARGLAWLAGYFAARAEIGAPAPISAPTVAPTLLIVSGSQTGNARRVAVALAADAERQGYAVRHVHAGDLKLKDLAKERLAYFVISTQGDGDPPEEARGFIDGLLGARAPRLPELRFAVLALGDSSYPRFCAIGRAVDARLAELGAERVLDLGEADVDIERVAAPWRDAALLLAKTWLTPAPVSNVTTLKPRVAAVTRDAPRAIELIENQRITTRSALKDVRHLVFDLDGSGIHYQPGDSLGVWPINPVAHVDALLAASRADGTAVVEHGGAAHSLRDWLTREREITRLAKPVVAALAERSAHVAEWLAAPNLPERLRGTQLAELLAQFDVRVDGAWLVAHLLPLAPRLYSISSSALAVGSEVHLTVAVDPRGAASRFLADSVAGSPVRAYVETNPRFHLPGDDTDLIMIGPGTGVAPFRAFVQERAERGARGRNWLFFGEQHFASQFLYQAEWLDALKRGHLARLDVAFSRDQAERVYVQHRLSERAQDIYAWLEGGASIYVCGDATRMAPDVDRALRAAIESARGRGDADDYVAALVEDGRYRRDVY